VTKLLPLDQAQTFNVYRPEAMPIAAGDVVRITKNFSAGGNKFRNNELVTVKTICDETVTFTDGRSFRQLAKLHLDQGVAVTSHAAQGKTVDQVVVSAPIASFSQVNAAQFYVSMSRARIGMALFTDCKAALKEAVAKPSERTSALELMNRALKKVRLPFLAKTPGMEHALREAARHQQSRSMGMER
jgi:ATP-dependent exoDNAse (exonuclease V) alpha subunit